MQFLKDVQTRGRPEYHRWLTPRTFAQRFGVAAADMTVVRAWLESKGFGIDEEPAGSRALIFSGTIGQVNEAFASHIHRYRWHGELHTANSSNPSVPRALAAVIVGFASLNDFRHRPQWIESRRTPQYTDGSGKHYLAPGDFATIYDLASPYAQGTTGMGRSIAVIGRSSVQSADLGNFRSAFGLSSTLPQIVIANSTNTAPPVVPGDETESDLDLEWSAAVAPSATIKFVTTASTKLSDGVDLASQWAVSNDLADVITVSYGSCESPGDVSGGTTFYHQLWQQAAAQGTSVLVSSGDSGAAGCDLASSSSATHGLGVNLICTSPYSTCVGGTQLSADVANPGTYWNSSNAPGTHASALSYIPEVVWNESGSNLDASGGGASIYFAKPEWQLATGVPSDGLRDVPDVALNAAAQHDPYLIYSSDNAQKTSNLEAVGGTSAAAPSMAGIAALLAQKQNGRVGNLNPILYGLAQLQANGGTPVFHLITSGNNSVPGQTGFAASAADPTYDQASGLGSVDGANLIAHWNDFVATTAGLSPTTVVIRATETVGSATLTLPSTTSWSAVVAASGGWLSVSPAGGTGSASLSFAAAANPVASARSGTITINGQVLTVTQAAAPGSGNAAAVSLSASSIDFGVDQVSAAVSSQRLLVSDTGNAALTLGTIGFSGAAAGDFSDSGTCTAGLVLNPGASCYLIVTFDPSAAGARTANLLIGISGGGSESIGLSGTGSAAGDTDGPLPLWSYALLASLLMVTTLRQRRRQDA